MEVVGTSFAEKQADDDCKPTIALQLNNIIRSLQQAESRRLEFATFLDGQIEKPSYVADGSYYASIDRSWCTNAAERMLAYVLCCNYDFKKAWSSREKFRQLSEIFSARSGLRGDKATLERVGEQHQLTRERVRQLQSRATDLVELAGPKLLSERPFKIYRGMLENANGLLVIEGTDEDQYIYRLINIMSRQTTYQIEVGERYVCASPWTSATLESFITASKKLRDEDVLLLSASTIPSTFEETSVREQVQDALCRLARAHKTRERKMTRTERCLSVLQSLTRPAHYSVIASTAAVADGVECTKQYEHAIHATLLRTPGIIRPGGHGMFCLEQHVARQAKDLTEEIAEVLRDSDYWLPPEEVLRKMPVGFGFSTASIAMCAGFQSDRFLSDRFGLIGLHGKPPKISADFSNEVKRSLLSRPGCNRSALHNRFPTIETYIVDNILAFDQQIYCIGASKNEHYVVLAEESAFRRLTTAEFAAAIGARLGIADPAYLAAYISREFGWLPKQSSV